MPYKITNLTGQPLRNNVDEDINVQVNNIPAKRRVKKSLSSKSQFTVQTKKEADEWKDVPNVVIEKL